MNNRLNLIIELPRTLSREIVEKRGMVLFFLQWLRRFSKLTNSTFLFVDDIENIEQPGVVFCYYGFYNSKPSDANLLSPEIRKRFFSIGYYTSDALDWLSECSIMGSIDIVFKNNTRSMFGWPDVANKLPGEVDYIGDKSRVSITCKELYPNTETMIAAYIAAYEELHPVNIRTNAQTKEYRFSFPVNSGQKVLDLLNTDDTARNWLSDRIAEAVQQFAPAYRIHFSLVGSFPVYLKQEQKTAAGFIELINEQIAEQKFIEWVQFELLDPATNHVQAFLLFDFSFSFQSTPRVEKIPSLLIFIPEGRNLLLEELEQEIGKALSVSPV